MNLEKFMAKNHSLKKFPENITLFFKIRIFIFNKLNIWDVWDLLPYRFNMWYYDVLKPIFKPKNTRIRKVIPKKWCDISELMINVNFEFIKSFYEDEYKADIVDWNATEHHKEFSQWLEFSYEWITQTRPQLQKDMEKAYPPSKPLDKMFEPFEDENGRKMFKMVDDGIPYDVKYAEVNRIEELINNKETEILTEFIKNRNFFWT
jgi:hypothetical protein